MTGWDNTNGVRPPTRAIMRRGINGSTRSSPKPLVTVSVNIMGVYGER